jgi:hypothetical protein
MVAPGLNVVDWSGRSLQLQQDRHGSGGSDTIESGVQMQPVGSSTDPPFVKKLLGFWVFLLIPWFPFAALAGMAFDGGRTLNAYIFVWSLWTYPVALVISVILKRWVPNMILLPFLNIMGFLISGSSHGA